MKETKKTCLDQSSNLPRSGTSHPQPHLGDSELYTLCAGSDIHPLSVSARQGRVGCEFLEIQRTYTFMANLQLYWNGTGVSHLPNWYLLLYHR